MAKTVLKFDEVSLLVNVLTCNLVNLTLKNFLRVLKETQNEYDSCWVFSKIKFSISLEFTKNPILSSFIVRN